MTTPVFAAVVYKPGQSPGQVLTTLTSELKRRGVNVHGLLQETTAADGRDAVDIRTGERTPIKRPTQYERDNKLCSLDIGQLTQATAVLRHALQTGADVVIVERFGKAERDGDGLADDLLELMASGVPTLVSVPEEALDDWGRFSGGLGAELPCDYDALLAWWESCQGAQA